MVGFMDEVVSDWEICTEKSFSPIRKTLIFATNKKVKKMDKQIQRTQSKEVSEQFFTDKYLVRNKFGVWCVEPSFDDEQIESAIENELRPAVLLGNKGAALCLLTMEDVAHDESEEIQNQIEKFAEEGDSHCQFFVASRIAAFYEDWGKTDEDFDDGKMMVRYFKNVIENHDVDIEKEISKELLWHAFEHGFGVKKNHEEATKWFDFSEDTFQAFLNRINRETSDRTFVL